MTFSILDFARRTAASSAVSPRRPMVKDISVVVPVRDNPRGIGRLVQWWLGLSSRATPRELLIVDDGSAVPVNATAPGVRVLRSPGRGPAAARNLGWRAARGKWIAFTDSDCVPDTGWPASFGWGWAGDAAMQGRVRPMRDDAVSLFYDAQRVLRPMSWTPDGRPRYLITASALVWREALTRVGGFDEAFPLAAGEDVDLGLRLAQVGSLRWCDEASVAHNFEPSVAALARRFARYGRGNRLLASRLAPEVGARFLPRPFLPRSTGVADHLLAAVAFASLAVGWLLESTRGR